LVTSSVRDTHPWLPGWFRSYEELERATADQRSGKVDELQGLIDGSQIGSTPAAFTHLAELSRILKSRKPGFIERRGKVAKCRGGKKRARDDPEKDGSEDDVRCGGGVVVGTPRYLPMPLPQSFLLGN